MARYPFCTTLCDEETGITLVYDFECELDIEMEPEGPDVYGVYVEGKAIHSSPDMLTKWIVKRVIDAAEKDLRYGGGLLAKVQERVSDQRWEHQASAGDRFYQFMKESAL